MRTVVSHRTAPSPIVSVNDVIIAGSAIAREAQNHACESPRAAWEAATQALVVRELLLQRARSLGLTAEPQSADGLRETGEEALIRVLLETEVRTPTADDAACRRYYDANPHRFRSPDLFEPLHILFKADRRDTKAYAATTQRAEAALTEVLTHPGCFELLARSLSDCPSASEGGRLGQVARGDTTVEFEAALVRLEPGQTCPTVVPTRYGLHVVRLERKVEGRALPFEQVRDRIAGYLEDSVWRRAVTQYVSLLAGDARIDGCNMAGATSPLVQ
jgi:peptidyl-prolyl cis-trans isomerase C